MELKEYLRVLRGRWVLILACTAVVVAVAGLITWQSTPQYSSSARLFISTVGSKDAASPDTAYQGGLAATQRVQSYAALVSDGTLVNRVVNAMDLDMSAADLSREIKAEVIPETVLLQVQVTDPSPRRAQAICAEVADQLRSLIGEIETPPGQSTPLLKGTLVSPASLPLSAVTPDPVRNLLVGLVVGLLAGAAAAVARELLDTSVKTSAHIEEALHAPLLGGIALDAQAATRPLITSLSSHAPRAESFRVLRTNLQFVDIDAPNKIIVITSSLPGEGKSSTAVNVAIALAQAGQRVLLVDGDLRRPQVAALLDLESAVGLTTVLLGRVELEDAVQAHEPSGLAVLTSGSIPPNPAELLQSFAMSELLEQIRADYDMVIVDSPPLLPVTDAALIAGHADGAVLVVRHGRTTREQLAGAHERLVSVDATILGAVFNRLKMGSSGDASGYGYGYGYGPDTSMETNQAPVEPAAADDAPPDVEPGATAYDVDGGEPDESGAGPLVPGLVEPDPADQDERATGRGAAVLSITKALRGTGQGEPRLVADPSDPLDGSAADADERPDGPGADPVAALDDDGRAAGDTADGLAAPGERPAPLRFVDPGDDPDAEPSPISSYTFLFSDEAHPDGSDRGLVQISSFDHDVARGDAPADDPDATGLVDDDPEDLGDEYGTDEDDADLAVPWTSGRRAKGRHRG